MDAGGNHSAPSCTWEGRRGSDYSRVAHRNAGIGFIEEGRASKAVELLRHRLTATSRVLRNGIWRSTASTGLVPGDVVHLRMGDLSPADIRIVQGEVLLDQSALTGESVAVEAGIGAMAYAAAVIRRGEATGEVTATGPKTYFGKTAELVRTARSTSHLAVTIFRISPHSHRHRRGADFLPAGLCGLGRSAASGCPPLCLDPAGGLGSGGASGDFHPSDRPWRGRAGTVRRFIDWLSTIEEAAGMDVLCTDKTGTLTREPSDPGSNATLRRHIR